MTLVVQKQRLALVTPRQDQAEREQQVVFLSAQKFNPIIF